MSRKYNIRWTEADVKEVDRVLRNYNAKVKRLEQKYQGTEVVLPERVAKKDFLELVGTRRDLQRELKSLQRFSKRGAEEIVKAPITENTIYMTKWQRTEMNRYKGIINAQRAKRYEMVVDIEMEHRNQPLGYTVGEFGMGKAEMNSLKPLEAFTKKMDKYDLQKKARSLRKHAQSDYFNKADNRLLENFLGSIKETYGGAYPEETEQLLNSIRNMGFKEFYKKFKANPGQFEITSDPPPDFDLKNGLTELMSTWTPEAKPKNVNKKRAKKKRSKK